MTEHVEATHDLLTTEMFKVNLKGGQSSRFTLPGLLAQLLVSDAISGFPNLAAQERSHWWRFLVRCGAKALHELELTVDEALKESVTGLERRIGEVFAAQVAPGGWCLGQPDPTAPGFMQPPTPDGQPPSEAYKERTVATLTSAIGSKNHDRKYAKGRVRNPEQVVYGLLAYQGGVIQDGRGYYKTPLSASRSGAGSGVPFMWGRLAEDLPNSFRADVNLLAMSRGDIQQKRRLSGDVWALWAEPWDGVIGLPASELDVAFIPMARMVRLGQPSEGLYERVWVRGSATDRVNDHTEGGHLGDLFTPIVVDPSGRHLKVRGTLGGGYGYREVVRLLFGEGAECSPSVRAWMREGAGDRALKVVFEGTAFGQGKTAGYHHREVILPPEARPFLDDPQPLQEVDEQLMKTVSESKKAVAGATRTLLHGDAGKRKGDDGQAALAGTALDLLVDQRYVESLVRFSDAYARGETEWVDEWVKVVSGLARDAFGQTAQGLPKSTNTMFERRVRADAYLGSRLKKLGRGTE